MTIISHFEILGIQDTATTDAIKAAYDAKILLFHPDKMPSWINSANEREAFTEICKRTIAAYRVLKNPAAKEHYIASELPREKALATPAKIAREEELRRCWQTIERKYQEHGREVSKDRTIQDLREKIEDLSQRHAVEQANLQARLDALQQEKQALQNKTQSLQEALIYVRLDIVDKNETVAKLTEGNVQLQQTASTWQAMVKKLEAENQALLQQNSALQLKQERFHLTSKQEATTSAAPQKTKLNFHGLTKIYWIRQRGGETSFDFLNLAFDDPKKISIFMRLWDMKTNHDTCPLKLEKIELSIHKEALTRVYISEEIIRVSLTPNANPMLLASSSHIQLKEIVRLFSQQVDISDTTDVFYFPAHGLVDHVSLTTFSALMPAAQSSFNELATLKACSPAAVNTASASGSASTLLPTYSKTTAPQTTELGSTSISASTKAFSQATFFNPPVTVSKIKKFEFPAGLEVCWITRYGGRHLQTVFLTSPLNENHKFTELFNAWNAQLDSQYSQLKFHVVNQKFKKPNPNKHWGTINEEKNIIAIVYNSQAAGELKYGQVDEVVSFLKQYIDCRGAIHQLYNQSPVGGHKRYVSCEFMIGNSLTQDEETKYLALSTQLSFPDDTPSSSPTPP